MTDNLGVKTQQTKQVSAPGRESDRALVLGLREEIDKALQPVLHHGTRLALIDFPNSGNVGDAAIWMGEKSWLERAGVEIVYTCDRYTYSRSRLQRELKDGTILWHGGGNLGDLWPAAQAFRERVTSEFPDNRIVQLPQSIWFEDPRNADRAASIFDNHPNIHLLLRDRRSLERAKELFNVSSSLCPDMAFALDVREPPTQTERDFVWLSRTDLEAADERGGPPRGVVPMDWLSDLTPGLGRPLTTYSGYALNKLITGLIRRWPRRLLAPHRLAAATYDWRASQRVARGYRLLGEGRVVVTNRLHGHILCCLVGQPHVLLGDKYGKLRSFYDTWTHGFSNAEFANSPAKASELAHHLLEVHREI